MGIPIELAQLNKAIWETERHAVHLGLSKVELWIFVHPDAIRPLLQSIGFSNYYDLRNPLRPKWKGYPITISHEIDEPIKVFVQNFTKSKEVRYARIDHSPLSQKISKENT